MSDELRIRRELAEALGHAPDTRVWELLVHDGWLEEWNAGQHDATIKQYKFIEGVLMRGRTDEQSEAHAVRVEGSRAALTERRQHVAALVIADAANKDWDVQEYRTEHVRVWPLKVDQLDRAILKMWIQDTAGAPDEAYADLTRFAYLRYLVPESGKIRSLPVVPGGVLSALATLTSALVDRYSWPALHVPLFVLCGIAPPWPPVLVSSRVNAPVGVASRITLDIDPALMPSEVAAVYRQVRATITAGRHRLPREKQLALVEFMLGRKRGEPQADRMAAWNAQFPQWKYTDARRFGTAVWKARERLKAGYVLESRGMRKGVR